MSFKKPTAYATIFKSNPTQTPLLLNVLGEIPHGKLLKFVPLDDFDTLLKDSESKVAHLTREIYELNKELLMLERDQVWRSLEKLDQAAADYADSKPYEDMEEFPLMSVEDAFVAGVEWREERASEGFDEWFRGEYRKLLDAGDPVAAHDWESKEPCKKVAWQASKILIDKQIAKKDADRDRLAAEKDADMAQLIGIIENHKREKLELLEYKFKYEQLCRQEKGQRNEP